MTPWEAYTQGGAALLLVVVISGMIWWLLKRLDRAEARADRIQAEKEELYKSSLQLLTSYQQRDAEALRAYQEDARRREGRSS